MTEDEMVGQHHRLNGHGLSKLWELVKEGERHQLGREEPAEQPPATPPPCRQHIPTNSTRGFPFLHILSSFYCRFFYNGHSDRYISSVQFSSVTQSCLTLNSSMDCSTLGLPVHHQLPELAQTCVH